MSTQSYKQSLLDLLSDKKSTDFPNDISKTILSLTSDELAHVFVDVAFVTSIVKFVVEEHWLQNKKSAKEISVSKFIQKHLKTELSPIRFLHDFFESSTIEEIGHVTKKSAAIETAVIQLIKQSNFSEKKVFARKALQLMSEMFELEHQLNLEKKETGLPPALCLYRTFDMLDEVFDLNYLADQGMLAPLDGTERLYEGAGVGVQSGYSSILIALRYLNPVRGSKFIDLGAGYGRVGLVVGLMRPDLDFQGYEYVPHRVAIASETSKNLGLKEHVHFDTQDLSLDSFQIPIADTYYIYDSFADATYDHVIQRLVEIGLKKKITVITKGNARKWFEHPSQKGKWFCAQQFDDGNLCFFRS